MFLPHLGISISPLQTFVLKECLVIVKTKILLPHELHNHLLTCICHPWAFIFHEPVGMPPSL